MKKGLELRLRKFLEKEFCLNKDGDGYSQECHVDYNDQLDDAVIKEILASDNPMEKFHEQFDPDFTDDDFDYVQKKVEEEFKGYDENQDEIDEWLHEHVSFYIPEEHFLGQKVCANLILDTGDGNYDFTLNNLLNGEGISSGSALLWLANQQGYTREQLEAVVLNNDFSGNSGESVLLRTILAECSNVSSNMNALAFFVKMTIKELIEYKEKPYTIVMKKGTSCGLIDIWNGAGGVLEIELERDVEIPPDKVRSFNIDGGDGYGVDQIYGMSSSFWTE
jgi:hypothetical protein